MSTRKRLIIAFSTLAGIIAIGTAGYMLIEGWNFMDAFYMTIISITTTGFSEVHSLSSGGRLFTIFLIISGSSAAVYGLAVIAQFVLEGQLGSALWRRNMKNRIAHLKNHYILCGYGRVGQEIAEILAEEKADFVIIDKSREAIAQAEMDNHLYVMADAAGDEALKEAGIDRAKGLIVAMGNDADSTYVILSARQLNPHIFIEARVSAPEAEGKLKRAGADRIVSPYSIGARRMAMVALQPDFIDVVSFKGHELHLENLTVAAGSPLVGSNIGDARKRSNAVILAVNKSSGLLVANPPDAEKLEAGDSIIAMGTRDELRKMEGFCESCTLKD
jgi:voltage-gated potassium channel